MPYCHLVLAKVTEWFFIFLLFTINLDHQDDGDQDVDERQRVEKLGGHEER